MSDDILERLRHSNPVPGDPGAPPIEPVLKRLGAGSPAALAPRWRGGMLPALGALAALAVVAVALVLAGHGARRATPGSGARPAGLRGAVFATGSFVASGRGVVSVAQCYPCRAGTRAGQVMHYRLETTRDGGRSWQAGHVPAGVDIASAEQFNLGAAQLDRSGDVWAMSSRSTHTGLVFDLTVSHDGGLSWRLARTPVRGFITSLSMAGGEAWATSGGGCHGGQCAGALVFRGPATGSSLRLAPTGPWDAAATLSVTAGDARTAYVGVVAKDQPDRLLVTRNGGLSWRELGSPCPTSSPDTIVRAAGPHSVWAVCPQPGPRAVLERSDDGGLHWHSYPMPDYRVENLAPVSRRAAWSISDHGVLIRTSDGGAHWQRVWSAGDYSPRLNLPVVSAATRSSARIVAMQTSGAGTRVMVLRTTNGGASWRSSWVALGAH
jgi:photosystem II stability/assembly factor-like uncharacterized protein